MILNCEKNESSTSSSTEHDPPVYLTGQENLPFFANSQEKLSHEEQLTKIEAAIKNKYRQTINAQEKFAITHYYFDEQNSTHQHRTVLHNKQEYVIDQVDIIHLLYFNTYEKLKTSRHGHFQQGLKDRRQALSQIMREYSGMETEVKNTLPSEIERQLEAQRRRFIQFTPDHVIKKLAGNQNKPIFLQPAEIIALTYLRYHRDNPEIADHLRSYIIEQGLSLTV